jgi:hypothetical protein
MPLGVLAPRRSGWLLFLLVGAVDQKQDQEDRRWRKDWGEHHDNHEDREDPETVHDIKLFIGQAAPLLPMSTTDPNPPFDLVPDPASDPTIANEGCNSPTTVLQRS